MMKFDVFLCHHGPDKPAVRRFADALRARGLKPWLDEEQLRPGQPWQRELEWQIKEIGAAAVFVGPSGIGPWQLLEIEAYLRKFQKLECPVIPVLLPDAGDAPELPVFLEGNTWVDFRGKSADDREAMDRLVWGITGENPAMTIREPEPVYPDERTRELADALDKAYTRLEETTIAGRDATSIREVILNLRRKMRENGLHPGDFVGGRYRLIESLGQGGFAEVWKAYDRRRQQVLAVKVLHLQHVRDKSKRERFLRGARKMAQLDHPGVVRVLSDVPEKLSAREDCFFAMELCAGGDLRQAVKSGKLDRAAGLAAVLEIGDALAHAHARELVHRDVKPANILLTADGRAKLTDFDLVRAADTTGGTRTQAMGSFVYAAPEMMMNAKAADVPADVYGLAMTAAFVLHGGDLPPAAMWATESFLAALDVPEACRGALGRALAKEASERTATVETFCEELRDAFVDPPQRRANSGEISGDPLFTEIETPLDGVVPLWREIPAGEFVMGGSSYGDEKPRHRVEITSPFCLAAVPVTNAQFQAFRPDFEPHAWDGVSADELPFHPAVNLDWDDAAAFCEWLAKRHDWAKGARLPTEAEWEYACRAGTRTEYWSGDSDKDLSRVGWYGEGEKGTTHRVGTKPANPWGLYDVHGNVYEWTLTHWEGSSDYSEFADGRTIDPLASPADLAGLPRARRVVRGGGYWDAAEVARSAVRFGDDPSLRYRFLGFRVLCPRATLDLGPLVDGRYLSRLKSRQRRQDFRPKSRPSTIPA